MKQKVFVLLVCCILLFSGCNHAVPRKEAAQPTESLQKFQTQQPPYMIILRSQEELETMRRMAVTSDSAELERYMSKFGMESKSEIDEFLKIYDSVPALDLLDGKITFIMRQKGTIHTRDEQGNRHDTGKPYDTMCITIENSNGDWLDMEYSLLQNAEELAKYSQAIVANELPTPMQSSDKRIKIFSEMHENTDSGEVVLWNATIDGVCVRIKYSGSNAAEIDATLLTNAKIEATK